LSEIAGRRIYYLAAVAIVAIVLISAIAVTRPLTISPVSPATTPKTLQVTGTGTVSAAPDQALLLLGVVTQATTAADATSQNAAAMSSVLGALNNAGISSESIETVSYSLTPVYENTQTQTGPGKIIGYAVRNAIQVTVTDLASVGKVLDTAIGAGINEVQSVTFTLSKATLSSLEKQATQLAVQDADSQAKAVASSLGISLIGPISVSPGYTFQPTVERYMAASQPTTPIQPGTLQVAATVQVTYAFS
jgi:uncharacterized protein YggE